MSNIDWAALAAPIPEGEIKWFPSITKSKGQDIIRNGKRVAGCLAHIDARMVMDRLDTVVGPDNWSDRIEIIAIGNSITATCHLTVWGITRGDTGPTMQANSENAAKEAVSGALKRAAVKFGIGRELYDMQIQWLEWDGYKVLEQPKPRRSKPASNGNQRQPVSKPAPQNNAVREIMEIVDGIGGDLMEGGEVIHPKHSDSLDWMFAKNWAEFNRAYAESHPYFKSAEHVFATVKKLHGGVPKFGDVKDGLDDMLSKYASREADEAAA